jgi:hypothetical protein
LTVGVSRLILARMPRPNAFVRGAFVVTFALAIVACNAAAPPTPAPAYVWPTPTPMKSAAVGAKYAEALVAAFAGDQLAMHLDETVKLKGLYELDGASVNATMALDISGRDMKAHMVTKSAGKTTKMDLVLVGKTVYARVGGGAWKKVRRADFEQDITDIVRSLQLIRNPAYLDYVGLETIEKHKLHHLKANRKFPYLNSGVSGTYDKFDVWVKEDGTPVLVKAKISAVGAYGFEVGGTTEMRFSKFGGPIKIVAPKN